jgi:hypothetical protein
MNQLLVVCAIVLTTWGAVSGLVGVWVGHRLSRDWEKRQWVADNEIQEWKELLTILTTSFQTIVRTNVLLPAVPGEEIERLKEAARARFLANEILTNRIFISREMTRDCLFEKWTKSLEQFDQDHDTKKLGRDFGELNALILIGAREHIGNV